MKTALILANGVLENIHGKTTHGLVRGPSRYNILGVLDNQTKHKSMGSLLNDPLIKTPIYSNIKEALKSLNQKPDYCILGAATHGGIIPPEIKNILLSIIEEKISIISGLHQKLNDQSDLTKAAIDHKVELIDIRKAPPFKDLHFWTGKILTDSTPKIAILGVDCACGKRTTTTIIHKELKKNKIKSEFIYTGQTGHLQGYPYGIILDSLPNDFVSGELEHSILSCIAETRPEVLLIEGQSTLQGPFGPCGQELILSANAKWVILQIIPGRKYYEGFEAIKLEIPPLEKEIELIKNLGANVIALTINNQNLTDEEETGLKIKLQKKFKIPCLNPLTDKLDPIINSIKLVLNHEN